MKISYFSLYLVGYWFSLFYKVQIMTLTFRQPLGDEESRSTPHRIDKWCFNDAS